MFDVEVAAANKDAEGRRALVLTFLGGSVTDKFEPRVPGAIDVGRGGGCCWFAVAAAGAADPAGKSELATAASRSAAARAGSGAMAGLPPFMLSASPGSTSLSWPGCEPGQGTQRARRSARRSRPARLACWRPDAASLLAPWLILKSAERLTLRILSLSSAMRPWSGSLLTDLSPT